MATIVWIVFAALGSATLIVLAVLVVGLLRQIGRLSRSVAEMERSVRPILEEIQREAGRASERLSRLRPPGEESDAGSEAAG